jgi:hypothetical protein
MLNRRGEQYDPLCVSGLKGDAARTANILTACLKVATDNKASLSSTTNLTPFTRESDLLIRLKTDIPNDFYYPALISPYLYNDYLNIHI